MNWSAGLDENGRPTVKPGVFTTEEGRFAFVQVLKVGRIGPLQPIIQIQTTSTSRLWNSVVPIIKVAFSM